MWLVDGYQHEEHGILWWWEGGGEGGDHVAMLGDQEGCHTWLAEKQRYLRVGEGRVCRGVRICG